MKTLIYKLRFHAPAVFRHRDPDPNLERSLAYVPGATVRGACIGRWSGRKEADDTDFRRLFLDGSVRFLHAYPAIEDERSVPAPRSLYSESDVGSPAEAARDVAVNDELESIRLDPGERLTLSGRFVPPSTWSSPVTVVKTRMRAELHMERDRTLGKSTEGRLFNKVAIDAGQVFIGVVECDRDDDADSIHALLFQDPRLWLGDSRGAEYGADATVDDLSQTSANWQEVRSNSRNAPEDIDVTVVALLSDYVGVDPDTGEPSRDALLADLQAEGLTGQSLILGATETLPGYLGIARCPRPTVPVWQAGTVLIFPKPGTTKTRTVSLGCRTAEGYGRVAIGWQTATDSLVFATPPEMRKSLPPPEEAARIARYRTPVFLQWVREQIPLAVASAQEHGIRPWTSVVPSVLGQTRAVLERGPCAAKDFEQALGKRTWKVVGNLGLKFHTGRPLKLKELLTATAQLSELLPGVTDRSQSWLTVEDNTGTSHRVLEQLAESERKDVTWWIADALLDRMRREVAGSGEVR